jgi:hypothetical protein
VELQKHFLASSPRQLSPAFLPSGHASPNPFMRSQRTEGDFKRDCERSEVPFTHERDFHPTRVDRETTYQTLRSCSQPLQRWKSYGAALDTEEPLEFVDTQVAIMPFPLQDTKCDHTVGEVMELRRLRAGLTAS